MHIAIATTALLLITIPVGIPILSLITGKSTGQAPGDTYCTTGDYYTFSPGPALAVERREIDKLHGPSMPED